MPCSTPRRAASRPRGSPRPRRRRRLRRVVASGSPPRSMPSEARSMPVRRRSRSPRARRGAASRSYISFGTFVGRADLDRPVALEPGRGRDQLPDDHVLLQAEQPVDLALDRRVREHLRRLLERGGGEERLGGERRLGDAEDQRLERGLLALLLLHPRVLALEHDPVDHLAGQEVGRRRRCRSGPSSASAGRSARCACRGCRRPATCRPSAPRRRGRARSASSPLPERAVQLEQLGRVRASPR